jgi:hypothetical protein
MQDALITLTVALGFAAPAAAQVIRVDPPTEVFRDADPQRWSEPHLAIDPNDPDRLLATAFVTPLSDNVPEMLTGERCATFASRDAGRSWIRHDFALTQCADPQVAILADGQAVFLALADVPGVQGSNWLAVFHSGDGGGTWDPTPALVGRGHDHPAIAVDRSSAARKNWIYVTTHYPWRDGSGGSGSSIFVVRSRDGGKSFDRPTEVSPSTLHNFGEMPAVLSDGTVVSSFVDDASSGLKFERRRAWVMSSTDGATTFAPPRLANDVCGPPPGFQLSALVADTSDGPFKDRLYFACRKSGGGPVVVVASGDKGNTWNRPGVVVGPVQADVDARRVMTLAVNAKGVLGVLVVERHVKARDACLEATFSASHDGGASFSAGQRVAVSSCAATPADVIATRMFPSYGDYYGLVAMPDGRFRAMWPEMRDGASVLLTTTIQVEGASMAPVPKP